MTAHTKKTQIPPRTIALVAHDNCKRDLVEWVRWNAKVLKHHKLVCTGTTGGQILKALEEEGYSEQVSVERLKSGPLGGDLQLGSLIAEQKVDILIFFWDPMQPQPHDVDVKALLRIAVVYNVPFANNRATADYLISSELFSTDYDPRKSDFSDYTNRELPI
ncbi:MAG: methylglyoxal synthase [Sphingobacteriia bacterium]|nr:methylglyoxal synthase [Sphingobacteriia bacterium]